MSRYLGSVIEFDKNNYRVVQELAFLDDDTITFIEELLTSGGLYAFEVIGTHRNKKRFSDLQRKKWYVFISKILAQEDIKVSPDTIRALDYQLRLSYLPCSYVLIGGKDIPVPPSLADGAGKIITDEHMQEALQRIEVDYGSLGIDFSRGAKQK